MAPNQATHMSAISDVLNSDDIKSKKEIRYEGDFYDVTEWVNRHPGGKIIEFYTESGEDATVAIHQFHQRSTKKVMGIMGSFKKRPASSQELQNMGLEMETINRHESLTTDFQILFEELNNEGMFEPCLPHVTYRLLELLFCAILGIYMIFQESLLLKVVGIVSLAFFQGRGGFAVHEAGHKSLTGSPRLDSFFQSALNGLTNGLAGKWWSSQHNRHHAMPQRMKRDVDLNTLPLLAFNAKVVTNSEHGKSFFIQNQAKLFLPLDTLLVFIYWKFYLNPRDAIKRKSYDDLFFMTVHYIAAYYIGFVPYLVSVWLAGIYSFGNFSLAHTHLPVTTQPMHWVEYGLLHTMNVEPSIWCNWWMGYLNFQIEHHLFPTIPQFRHPLIADRVKRLAAKHGLPYRCESYTKAVSMALKNLEHVAEDLRHG